jgi:uncharacterized protein
MLVGDMNRRECEDLLGRVSFGRLACARDNQPYIVPIYFAFEPGRIYGFATMGQKIEWMRLNPLVCVEADEIPNETEWSSVVVQGRYEEFSDTPEYAEARRDAQSKLEKIRSFWWKTGLSVAQARWRFDRDITVFFCIHVDEITGRRASHDPVAWNRSEAQESKLRNSA